jgi:hypothetical protein
MNFGVKLELNIPSETSLAAHQVYNPQNIYLSIGDYLQSIADQIHLSLIDSTSILDLNTIFRLALASSFQYAELLPDSLAANASLKRLDWKYALYLPVNHPGIHKNALCDFRQGLHSSSEAIHEFGKLLQILSEFGLFKNLKNYSLDPDQIISIICLINRINKLQTAMKAGLSLISSLKPDWLAGHVSPHWFNRYKTGPLISVEYFDPADLQKYADQIGEDLYSLLSKIKEFDCPELATRMEIQSLNRLFKNQYISDGEKIGWKNHGCVNCVCDDLKVEGGHL